MAEKLYEVFKCSNPKCDAIWNKDPHGHCPACMKVDGGGWSCRTMPVLALPAAVEAARR